MLGGTFLSRAVLGFLTQPQDKSVISMRRENLVGISGMLKFRFYIIADVQNADNPNEIVLASNDSSSQITRIMIENTIFLLF